MTCVTSGKSKKKNHTHFYFNKKESVRNNICFCTAVIFNTSFHTILCSYFKDYIFKKLLSKIHENKGLPTQVLVTHLEVRQDN